MNLASRSRYWLPLVPLLVLSAFVYWLDQQVQRDVTAAANSQRHDPDGIMENFSATKMDMQGLPSFLLSARQLKHYPDHDTTELDMPRMTMLNIARPTVHIQSLRGNISSQGNEVMLHDDVRVSREAAGTQPAMTLRTEYLRVLPNKEWADTDRAVTMVNDGNTVRATGMEMDNKARVLKLLSQVRSEHLPHAK